MSNDLHALSVQAALRRRSIKCAILESDRIAGGEVISTSIGQTSRAFCATADGQTIPVSEISLVWWRRPKAPQQVDAEALTADQISLINNDSYASLVGMFGNAFRGKWISSPSATEYASNKPIQLAAAQSAGFRIPDSLITQSPSEVENFYLKHDSQVIVKPVAGTPGPLLFTQPLQRHHLDAKESIKTCPTIYQELIPGTRHIRLNCFGNKSFAGLIQSTDLDWRPNLNVPVSRWPVPDHLHKQVRQTLDALGLEMGIVDLKETPDGEIVWLEVNPQGQFLFLEGLTGEPLTEIFADYLAGELQCRH